MSIRFLKNGKSGDGSIPLNIFTGLQEPEKKDGIWLQTNKIAEHYISDQNFFVKPIWKSDGSYANIPYSFYQGSIARIGNDVYLFGGIDNKYNVYKYNIVANTFTQLVSLSRVFYDKHGAVAIGKDIYLFGCENTIAYKYDTINNTYTQLTSLPNPFNKGVAVAVGTDVYLLGTNTSSVGTVNVNYKYDTLTNTYTRLTDIPYNNFISGSAVAIGTNIYLIGGTSDACTLLYKYDTLTNIYTKLIDIPYIFYKGSAVVIGTNIYLIGGNSSKTFFYKYDTITNTFTKLTDIPYNFSEGCAVAIDNNIYLFGGNDNQTKIQSYNIGIIKEYNTDNTIVIEQGSNYKTELIKTNFETEYPLLFGFKDVYFYTLENNFDNTIPTYYGNGTEWIKFKN